MNNPPDRKDQWADRMSIEPPEHRRRRRVQLTALTALGFVLVILAAVIALHGRTDPRIWGALLTAGALLVILSVAGRLNGPPVRDRRDP